VCHPGALPPDSRIPSPLSLDVGLRSSSSQSGLENSQRMLESKLEELKKKLEDEAFH
jgi:hypothetical protein